MKPSTPQPADDDRLDAFVQALRSSDGPQRPEHEPTRAAATVLRAALLRAGEQAAADDAQREDALIAAWQREGLLGVEASSRPKPARSILSAWLERLRSGSGGARWLTSASAIALVALVVVNLPAPDEPAVPAEASGPGAGAMRGAEQAVRLEVADPAALVSQLERLFAERSVRHRVVAGVDGSVVVQAQLTGHGDALTGELRRLGVPVPSTGRLNLLVSGLRPASSP